MGTLVGSVGRKPRARSPRKTLVGAILEVLLIVLGGAATGLALALGYVPEAL